VGERRGNYFEDFGVGQTLIHPTPRTVTSADTSLYISYTGARHPLSSSTPFAQALGLPEAPLPELLVFHMVFGKTVADVSQNAVANLGYADVRFGQPVFPGTTLRAESEVIGLRETKSGKTGIVYVTTRGLTETGEEVLRFHRWVLVEKRKPDVKSGVDSVPLLPDSVAPGDVPVASGLTVKNWKDVSWATGSDQYWEDYATGTLIHHPTGMTIDAADHTGATRLYQNTARVHFDGLRMSTSKVGQRLVYGGHVISVAHALSYVGLENVLCMAAWSGGTHANPTVAGDTIYARTEVLGSADVVGHPGLGALRLRLCATKNLDPMEEEFEMSRVEAGRTRYHPQVVLELDYWGLIPKRSAF